MCCTLQVEFLEVRLAEVMAYADIPPHMRPVLSELPSEGRTGAYIFCHRRCSS